MLIFCVKLQSADEYGKKIQMRLSINELYNYAIIN